MANVSLHQVRKVYENGFVAVHDVSLEIADGELVVLVGPSGCGKSTTLRMIAGLETISSGEVRIGGRRVNELPAAERDIAMVFQSYALYPHMSVRENLGFGLKLRGVQRGEADRRVLEVARLLEIDDVLDRRPRQLSGGQRQRVAVGRAIVRKPQVFLFDEPLSNLDAKLRAQTRKEIAALHRRLAATIVYVTHDQVEAMTLGDRIVVLDRGRVQQVGAPRELYQRPANRFVAGFIGSPAMNFIEATLEGEVEGGALRMGTDATRICLPGALVRSLEPLPDGRVVVGVRPEDFVVFEDSAPQEGHLVLDVRFESSEMLGPEMHLYVSAGSEELVCRVPARDLPQRGERLHIGVPLARLHFFRGPDGERVGDTPDDPHASA